MICRICSNKEGNTNYDVPEMMYGTNEIFKYFQCSECECLQIEEIPSDVSKYYPGNYYSYDSKNKIANHYAGKLKAYMIYKRDSYAAFGKGRIGKALSKIYPTAKYKGISRLKLNKQTRILDIGCGAGHFLDECGAIGFKNLLGIDPFNKMDLELSNGVRVLKKKIGEIEGKWDLITFHHSFEHIPDQAGTLQQAAKLLDVNGYCMIRIPIVSSYAWKHYGVNWVQLDAPRHFYLHSIKSMKLLAGKASLELFDVVCDSTSFQFWGSEQYENGISLCDVRSYAVNPQQSIFSNKDITGYDEKAIALNKNNQGDQAIFYFKKPS